MAGWLGSNFTAQLDQLKKGVSQVSTIIKDTLVVDKTWDQEEVEYFLQFNENNFHTAKNIFRMRPRRERTAGSGS